MAKRRTRKQSFKGLPSEHASAGSRESAKADNVFRGVSDLIKGGRCREAYNDLLVAVDASSKAEAHERASDGRMKIPRQSSDLASRVTHEFRSACLRERAEKKRSVIDRILRRK